MVVSRHHVLRTEIHQRDDRAPLAVEGLRPHARVGDLRRPDQVVEARAVHPSKSDQEVEGRESSAQETLAEVQDILSGAYEDARTILGERAA